MVQPFWEPIWQIPCDPEIALRHLSQRRDTCSCKNLYTNVHTALLIKSPKLEISQMSFNEWIVKLWDIHTVEYYWPVRRNKLTYDNLGKCKGNYAVWRSQSPKVIYSQGMIPFMWQSYSNGEETSGCQGLETRWGGEGAAGGRWI